MTVLINNLKLIFGKKKNIFFMLIVPIASIFYIITATTQESKYNIIILDKDNTHFTKLFKNQFKEENNIVTVKNRDEIKNMIVDRKVDIAIIFEKGFTEKMLNNENVKVENIMLDGTNQNQPLQTNVASFVSSAKEIAKLSNSEKEFNENMDKFVTQKFSVEYKRFSTSYLEDAENAVTALGYLAAGMLFFIMMTTNLLLVERMSGVTDRLATAPIKVSSYYLQHFISFYFIAVLQAVISLSILPLISVLSFGNTLSEIINIIIVACTFALVCVSIGVFVNSISKNSFVAGTVTTLIELPLLMLGGCLWPREIMPEFLQKIGNFLPTTWYMKASERLVNGKGLSSVAFEVVGMAGFAAAVLLLTIIMKRKRISNF